MPFLIINLVNYHMANLRNKTVRNFVAGKEMRVKNEWDFGGEFFGYSAIMSQE